MPQIEQLPFDEVIQRVHALCAARKSGTVHILTDQGGGANFVLNDGEIVDVAYRTFRGNSALMQLRETKKARFVFKQHPTSHAKDSDASRNLPSNQVIFARLGVSVEEQNLTPAADEKRVLVVEDGGVARKAIVRDLNAAGYATLEAPSAEQAMFLLLTESPPDIVLLDLILPDRDGYDVLTMMKDTDALKKIPVIIMTSRDSLMDKVKGKFSGTDEYLTKPIETKLLLDKMRKYLG